MALVYPSNKLLSIDLVTKRERVLAQIDLSACSGCDECGLRCAAHTPATHSEIEDIQEFLNHKENEEYVNSVIKQDKTVNLGDGVTVQMCLFRDMKKNRCSVYSVRPLICRLLGHVEMMPCPIEKVEKYAITSDVMELMSAYSKEERITIEVAFCNTV